MLITDLDAGAVQRAVGAAGQPRARPRSRRLGGRAQHQATAAAAAELGPLKVWVNNAGIAQGDKACEHADADVEATVRVNLLGVMHGSRAAVAAMREDGGGHILNIASMSSFGPVPGLGVYAATKAAVLSFSAGLQGDLDLAGIPIRVHALCPGRRRHGDGPGRAGRAGLGDPLLRNVAA